MPTPVITFSVSCAWRAEIVFTTEDNVARRIQMLKCFINPEPGLVRTCLAKGGAYYSSGNYQVSNKYFSKVLLLASQDSEEYKIAKSRVTNV